MTQETAKKQGILELCRDYVAADWHIAQELLQASLLCEQEPMVQEVAMHLIASGGKRLRPLLVLLCAKFCQEYAASFGYVPDLEDGFAPSKREYKTSYLFDYEGKREDVFPHHQLAVVVELMHAATLLHDDVVDESLMRRGKPSANALFGNKMSVLVGDYLLGRAFLLMVEARSYPALRMLSRTATSIAQGEVMQLAGSFSLDLTMDHYCKIIEEKTAALFSAATCVGALAQSMPTPLTQQLQCYGTLLGILFQLVDDILDYSGKDEEMGKKVGDDFVEGKVTLPVLLLAQSLLEEQEEKGREDKRVAWLHHLFSKHVKRTPQDLVVLQDYFIQKDIFTRCHEVLDLFVERANREVARLPFPQEHKAMLSGIVNMVLERDS